MLVARWLIIPVALLLAGVANYFLAGTGDKAPAREATVLLSAEDHHPQPSKTLLFRLGWGGGASQIALRRGTRAQASFEALARSDGGELLIVDHPSSKPGARLRWFDSAGRITTELHLAPGATLFTPLRGGRSFAYVVAKRSSAAEQLVVRASTGTEETYTVPLGLNSGSIVPIGADLFITAQANASDIQNATAQIVDRLVPVRLSGRQVDDTTADKNARDGSFVGFDHKVYQYAQSSAGYDVNEVRQTRVKRLSDGAVLRVPDTAQVLGADSHGRLWLALLPQELDRTSRFLSAWPSAKDTDAEILVVQYDGHVAARLLVPYSDRLAETRQPYWLADEGLYAATADSRGLSIWRYEVPVR
jgi:hypothetical protein